ncbi:MAG TPA: hypothetical protein VN951_16205 [Pyrinomonadaceae bacterium]|nr:hypothetical protein [Pyrinomonadaceae bacterium]
MSKLRVHSFSISIDGFGAGRVRTFRNPLGVGGERENHPLPQAVLPRAHLAAEQRMPLCGSNSLTLKALANSSPGFALKPWDEAHPDFTEAQP